jgi:hypothetical protein
MVEIGKYGVLRPAQCIAHVAAEWRQLHEIPRLSPTSRLLSPRGAGRVAWHLNQRRQTRRLGGDIAAKRHKKLDAERDCYRPMTDRRLLGGRRIEAKVLESAWESGTCIATLGLLYITYKPNELVLRIDCFV